MKGQGGWDGLRIAGFVVLGIVVWGVFMQSALYRALNDLAYVAIYAVALFFAFVVARGLYYGLSEYFRKAIGKPEDPKD
jgi:hypothetical protein